MGPAVSKEAVPVVSWYVRWELTILLQAFHLDVCVLRTDAQELTWVGVKQKK